MSEKKSIDARNFQEIWNSLNILEQKEISRRLQKAGISDDTLLIWRKGRTKTRPRKPYIDSAVRTLRGAGFYVLPDTLFPIK